MKTRTPPAVVLLALLVPLLALVPTGQGYQAQSPPERIFLGFRYMAGDHYQYAAFARQARDRTTLFMENPFTGEPQRGVFVLPYFWLVGTVARVSGLEIPAVWNVLRVLGGALYIVAFWHLAGIHFEERRLRLLATVLFSLAGGLDWIVTTLRVGLWPALRPVEHAYDYFWNWSTFGAMQVPNWIWPGLGLVLVAQVVARRPRGAGGLVFLLLPTIWFLHAYTGMVAYLAFGLLPLVPLVVAAAGPAPLPWPRARENLRLALPGLASFVPVAGYLRWAWSDEVFRLSSTRGLTWTDHFSVGWYPLSYGLVLPLAWFGIRAVARERTLASDLLLAWLAAAFILSVNPLYAGVKFQYLLFPPLAILAATGVRVLLAASAVARRAAASRATVAAVATLLCLNAPVSLVKDWGGARTDRDLYASAAELAMLRWLDAQPDGLVLASYRTGNRIPWLAGKKVYLGHWFLTPAIDAKARELAALFSAQAPAAFKRDLLRRSGARYVVVEPGQSPGLDAPDLPLRIAYAAGGYVVHEVRAAP